MQRKTILLSEDLVKRVVLISKKQDRDFSGSLRYALRIGLLAIENPELTSEEIKDILEAKVEIDAGMVEALDIENL